MRGPSGGHEAPRGAPTDIRMIKTQKWYGMGDFRGSLLLLAYSILAVKAAKIKVQSILNVLQKLL